MHFSGWLICTLAFVGFFTACSEPIPRARPYGYHRILFPDSVGRDTFRAEACPFVFTYPETGVITREATDSCWVDIRFPEYDLKWHITYRNIPESKKAFDVHLEEHRRLVYQHSKKATEISVDELSDYPDISGLRYNVSGNVGTPAYYFLHDSTRQQLFLMTFYFNTALKNDSLRPVISYMRDQIDNSMATFRWR